MPSLFRVDDFQLWVTFNTRKVTDPTYVRFVQTASEDVLVKKVSWRDNPWFPEGLNKQRLELQKSDPIAYAHVWEGEPDTRHTGNVYAKWLDQLIQSGRAVENLYDPSLSVYTAWDFGWSDNTSIIFWQQVGKETRVIDCYEAFNQDIPHYVNLIDSKPYKYARHYAPQDAANKMLAAGGKSIYDIAQKAGLQFYIYPETTHAHRHEALRMLFASMWIDKTTCRDLIHALMNYQFKFNEDLQLFSPEPVHDWSSHYSTAAELMARVVKEQKPVQKQEEKEPLSYSGKDSNILARVDIKAYIKRKERENG